MTEVVIACGGVALFSLFVFAILRGVAMDDQMVRDAEAELKSWIEMPH